MIDLKTRAGTYFKIDEKITVKDLDKKLLEVLASRGKRGTSRLSVLRQLSTMAYVAQKFGPGKVCNYTAISCLFMVGKIALGFCKSFRVYDY